MASTAMPSNSEFPSNSKMLKKEQNENTEEKRKKVEPVVTGKVIQRKKPLGRRFMETFVGGDDAKSVGEYILFDVFVPAAKTMLADAASQGAERLLFGEVRRPRSTGNTYRPNYTNYSRPSAAPADRRGFSSSRETNDISRRGRAQHNFGEVIIPTRGEAEDVLSTMTAILEEYDVVTVMDFYDLVQITGNFTDEKYGWFDLRSANIQRIREGFVINLPRPVNIDN